MSAYSLTRLGIISACAERTISGYAGRLDLKDHLRVCGADNIAATLKFLRSGSSPRVRSGRHLISVAAVVVGIISACAERTWACRMSPSSPRDHLRVCGADMGQFGTYADCQGSSPRVRSGLTQGVSCDVSHGIISACAERTARASVMGSRMRDHLRVCGADGAFALGLESVAGSSPRVRSGHSQTCADQL